MLFVKGPRIFRDAVLLSAVALVVGSLSVRPAEAGIYLSLRPVAASLTPGAQLTGSDLTGYTLTLPTQAASQTFQYDLVVRITQGLTSNETASRSLGSLFGAVRTSSSGAVTGGHVAFAGAAGQVPTYSSPAPALELDPTSQLRNSPQIINAGMISGALPGTAAPASYGSGVNGSTLNGHAAPAVLGVGPQFDNFASQFDNSIPQTAFGMTFAFGGAQGYSPFDVAAGMAVVVARATVSLSSSDANAVANFNFVGGNGGNGTAADDRWAQWFENGANFQTHNFNPALTTAVRLPLTVHFGASAGIAGDYNGDGFVDAADYTVWADHFGQTGAATPGDGNADGRVDAADYTVWADHFGLGTAPGGALSGAAIPEPAVAPVLLGAAAAALLRRRP